MATFTIKPSVNATREFIEIATDFSNPLDLVREAISNAFDARATEIKIRFLSEKSYGERVLVIELEDNGHGMDQNGLQAFFDLGNSKRGEDPSAIGEKGHGTKVFFNSSEITVTTICGGKRYEAVLKEPFKAFYDQKLPEVSVTEAEDQGHSGTLIRIKGYNSNRGERFTHARLKDYIMWFTKFGSWELQLGHTKHKDTALWLKGLDADEPERLMFGHYFPSESTSIDKLLDQVEHLVDAPHFFVKRFVFSLRSLPTMPDVKYEAVFYVEGDKIKRQYNKMLKRPGGGPKGEYTVQERYGLWLCKDYIPIQRANEWIGTRGTEFTRLHAFLNCQELRLTANRGSVANTPGEVLEALKKEIGDLYTQIINSDDWRNIDYLESQASAYRTAESEKKDYVDRLKRFNKANMAAFHGRVLCEPSHESGVYALVAQILTLQPDALPFEVLDYNTHKGYDLLVKSRDKVPLTHAKLYYVELKKYLEAELNHSFENLFSIVCWDTTLKDGDLCTDLAEETRVLRVIGAEGEGDYTRYYLDNPKKNHKIEVFVLQDYLKQRLKLEFRPRTEKTVIK